MSALTAAAGDVGLDPGRIGCLPDDPLNGFDRFVAQRLARLTGQIHLHEDCLAIGALGGPPGEFIPPEVLDAIHVFGIGFELLD